MTDIAITNSLTELIRVTKIFADNFRVRDTMNVTLQCSENSFFIVSYTMWQAATSPNKTHLLTNTSSSDMELLELT